MGVLPPSLPAPSRPAAQGFARFQGDAAGAAKAAAQAAVHATAQAAHAAAHPSPAAPLRVG